MSRSGPTLSTLALQQVGSYLGYTGRNANGAAKAARDPYRKPGVHRSSRACGIRQQQARG